MPSSHTKEKILSAARSLLTELGVDALSVRAISSQAGVSTIGIYNHFGSLSAVSDTLRQEGWGLLQDAFKFELTQASLPELAKRVAITYLNFADRYPAYYDLLFCAPSRHDVPSERTLTAAQETTNVIAQRLCESGDPYRATSALATDLMGVAHGLYALRQQTERSPFDDCVRDAVLSDVCEAVLRAHIKQSC